MTGPLDTQTVLLMHQMSFFVGALCFLYVRSRSTGNIGLGLLSIGFFLSSLASTFVIFGRKTPDLVYFWSVVAFLAGTIGYAVFVVGVCRVSSQRKTRKQWLVLLIPALGTTALVWAGWYVVTDTRASIFNALAAVMLMFAACCVYRDRMLEVLPVRWVLSLALGISAVLRIMAIIGYQFPMVAIMTPANAFFLSIVCHFAITVFVMALVKERAEANLLRLANIDALTGIANRRSFFEALPETLRIGDAIVMVDIDHFKKINDTYGHLTGDDVLARVAQEMSALLRPNDVIARFGGEEFVILLRASGNDNPLVLADAIRAKVSAVMHMAEDKEFAATLSMGIAVCEEKVNFAKLLLKKADIALYAAKGAGRNRLTMFRSQDDEPVEYAKAKTLNSAIS
ncbi:GGDEF domain-containing protein [Agrobacterium sp.]|uniref:GGDEF domain-containing protein n=1 Tax=Agrobacterium sp. TaxID=361 RepID=UPI0028A59723|nr:GGDEF domain-containing protein [Agrobacterium sp.]